MSIFTSRSKILWIEGDNLIYLRLQILCNLHKMHAKSCTERILQRVIKHFECNWQTVCDLHWVGDFMFRGLEAIGQKCYLLKRERLKNKG